MICSTTLTLTLPPTPSHWAMRKLATAAIRFLEMRRQQRANGTLPSRRSSTSDPELTPLRNRASTMKRLPLERRASMGTAGRGDAPAGQGSPRRTLAAAKELDARLSAATDAAQSLMQTRDEEEAGFKGKTAGGATDPGTAAAAAAAAPTPSEQQPAEPAAEGAGVAYVPLPQLVEEIKKGMGIDPGTPLVAAVDEAAGSLGIAEDVAGLKAKAKANRVAEELALSVRTK